MPIRTHDGVAFPDSAILCSIAARLKEYREARKWSVLKLARTGGVSHAFMKLVLELQANPSILILDRLATNLDIPLIWLLGLSDERPVSLPPAEDTITGPKRRSAGRPPHRKAPEPE